MTTKLTTKLMGCILVAALSAGCATDPASDPTDLAEQQHAIISNEYISAIATPELPKDLVLAKQPASLAIRPPRIISFSPTVAPAGAVVTITGEQFGWMGLYGNCVISFYGGSIAGRGDIWLRQGLTYVSGTQLTTTVPVTGSVPGPLKLSCTASPGAASVDVSISTQSFTGLAPNTPPPPPPPAAPSGAVTVQQSTSGAPLSGAGTYRAVYAEAFFDANTNGAVDGFASDAVPAGATPVFAPMFPRYVVPAATPPFREVRRSSRLAAGANLVVYLQIPGTAGALATAVTSEQFIAVHLAVNAATRTVTTIAIEGGDFNNAQGRVMSASPVPNSLGWIGTPNVTLSAGAPTRIAGRISASMSAPEVGGAPGATFVTIHNSLIDLTFDVPVSAH